MASIENSDYNKLVKTINAMQELVTEADADGRFMLYGEQCKEMVHGFIDMRDRMSIVPPDAEPTPILRELLRMACEAKSVLGNCSCEDQTSWLQAALIQNDKIVFDNIWADLKWGYEIFLIVGNSSSREPLSKRVATDDLTFFNNDQMRLKEELHRLITDEDNTVPELDKLIATFLRARFNTNVRESMYFAERVVSWQLWDPTDSDNNNLSDPAASTIVQAIRLFDIKLARKLFPSEISDAFLQKEISIMAKLTHPNVVRFISSSKNVRNPAIIMECVEMTLEAYLKERFCNKAEGQGAGWLIRPTDQGNIAPFGGALDYPQMLIAVDIMYQISSGMAYLHSQPHFAAHLDLKTSNILVNNCKGCAHAGVHVKIEEDSQGHVQVKIEEYFKGYVHVKIADMGLSKLGSKDNLLVRNSNPRRGTTLWQAPETFKKGKLVCMQKTDLYAFGIICWEILHGMEPRLEPDMKLSKHRQEVKRGRRLKIDTNLCPPYLERIIQDCWHRNPERRPSFSDCSLALQSYKAMLLGIGEESLLDIKVAPETLVEKVKRLWRILILHVRQR